jgi:hypothetical protein
MATGSGTKADPWVLKTPPGASEYTMYRDDEADPPVIVCQVGSTQLKYHAQAIEDTVAMLKAHGDWMDLGAADEQRTPSPARSKRGLVTRRIRSVAGTERARATAVGSGCTCRRCWRRLGWPS